VATERATGDIAHNLWIGIQGFCRPGAGKRERPNEQALCLDSDGHAVTLHGVHRPHRLADVGSDGNDIWCTIFAMLERGIAFVLVLIIMASCTSSPKPEPSATRAAARYFFVTPHDRGVLEVTTGPASICYETQSYPATPITIVSKDDGVLRLTYESHAGELCDLQVSAEVASRLIEDPAAFLVRWSPQAGEPVVETKLVAQGS
jgi:hypothetical protein